MSPNGTARAYMSAMPATHILSWARDLTGGGVERALLRLAGGWVEAGRQVTLVVGRVEGPLATELPVGLSVVEIGATSPRRLVQMLVSEVRAGKPDILFCAGNTYTAIAAAVRLRLGRSCPPIVAKMSNAVHRGDHNALIDWGHGRWLAQHGRFLDHLVAMTPATATEAAQATGMVGRTGAIPNPPPLRRADAALPPLPPGKLILGVGRLVAQKRWDRLIATLPALPGVPLVVLGDGPGRAALLNQAERLGVADRVHLPGHASDPLAVMAQATVLALPSDFEGVPGVLREALSVGTPVVTTDSSPAVHEIVATPALGSVVPRDDPEALIAALRHWLAATARPSPVPMPGSDSARRYLDLFDRLTLSGISGEGTGERRSPE